MSLLVAPRGANQQVESSGEHFVVLSRFTAATA
jgi:hypothetical protein